MLEQIIKQKLEKNLNINSLTIINESYKHKLHKQNLLQNNESHFKIKIISDDFKNLKLIDRHKLIYNILHKELTGKIHALSINAFTIDEVE